MPQKREFKFLPLTISLETLGGVSTPLVLRGTPLPALRKEVFSTAADDQTSVELKIFMGESAVAKRNLALGSFHMVGIPKQPKAIPQIEVVFEVDKTCAVTVKSTLLGTEVTSEQRFAALPDLSDTAVARILQEAEAGKTEDDHVLRRLEAINEANRLITQADGVLRTEANEKLNSAVAQLGLALQADDVDEIRKRTDELKSFLPTGTSPYAGFDFSDFIGSSSRPQRPRTSRKSSKTQQTGAFEDIFKDLFSGDAPKTTSSLSGASAARAAKPAPPAVAPAPHLPSLGKIFGGTRNFALDPQLCFVLMPFADKYQALYDDHIRPTIEAAGLVCQRADDVLGTNSITWDIWERINRARFLIADLTDQNANVFYELGLAHAISKDVILLTQSMNFVPFDLKALRCIVYDFTPRGVTKMQSALKGTVDTLMKGS